MKKIKQVTAMTLAAVLILSSFSFSQKSLAADEEGIIQSVTTDKAMYDPSEKAELSINLTNLNGGDLKKGIVEIRAKHLEKQVGSTIKRKFTLKEGKSKTLTINWKAPADDFKGYLIEVNVKDEADIVIDSDTVGVDVSSSWTKFPRYGYVWNFTEDVDVERRIEKLKNYHINALQYYDWKYRHHKPVADNLDVWDDWSGRPIYGDSVRSYIAEAQKANMVNMSYNMAYAAVSGYENDGVKQDWALYYSDDNPRGEGHFNFKMSDETPTGITHLYFFDMSNKGWQNYIFAETNKVFDAFEFDGWHSDTVGEWGEMKNSKGETLFVKDTYTEFLNAAKTAIGDNYLVFNPVGAQGIEKVNISDVDVLYTEMWPWDRDINGELYDSYNSLKTEIERSREESGGKSLVIPAYMSYDYGESNPGSPFNTSAVLLTGASVYAAGGSRMELGDDGNMLSNEYFPAQNLYMTDNLEKRIAKQYDFIVAYQNLLRDGQTETENAIEVVDYENNENGDPNTIWTYGKKDDNYEIIQMINLLGVSQNDWRANYGEKEKPNKICDFKVKYYYSDEVNSVWLASPDEKDGRSQALSFTKGSDESGDYIVIDVPSLEYWNMIYMSGDEPQSTDDEQDSRLNVTKLMNHFAAKRDLRKPLVKQLSNTLRQADHHLKKGSDDKAVNFLEKALDQLNRKSNNRAVTNEAREALNKAIDLVIYDWSNTNTCEDPDDQEEIPAPSGELINGGFEKGTQGWTFSGTAGHGVDNYDAYEGYKYWIWGAEEYTATVSQTVKGLENGTYTVSAMLKQNTGIPIESKMEVSGYGGDPVDKAIPHSQSYEKISVLAEVTNGELTISFKQQGPGDTNLQIDNVEIVKEQ
ncbi:glycoside hydrolase family 66 protein [Jeotgalibacillus campisalis]|uniref:Dextranase n=1 Tax=Jeotgalibacillus campisalis TaxID=220754 RepID=A0A0C2VCY3_9BACL|nr:glycoside hydrolase family 66 protein [Jeotgalibacillus campisalis]KIL46812.1 dextranase [Jeotgalibacillus campisalis]